MVTNTLFITLLFKVDSRWETIKFGFFFGGRIKILSEPIWTNFNDYSFPKLQKKNHEILSPPDTKNTTNDLHKLFITLFRDYFYFQSKSMDTQLVYPFRLRQRNSERRRCRVKNFQGVAVRKHRGIGELMCW